MNYPHGPYGQGFGGQPGQPQQPGYTQPPGYPQQPGYPPPPSYPQQAAYPPGYPGGLPGPYGPVPTPPASPSGVTGIIAGVLAGLGGLANVFGGLGMAFGLAVIVGESPDTSGSGWSGLIAITMLNIVAGLLLLIGTVLLFLRKMAGRWLVAAGCSVSIVSALISLALPATIEDYEYQSTGSDLVALIFPIATLVLVLVPPTGAWIRAKENPVAPQFYPPYPG
ncbi:hypothetical protein [Mycolicibacterium neworleansense]|uniref:Uncharacterized protein n=1 Tax=Mycolicibacterium neworleansense TaxID=146018 RepID=A0A0H5RTJ3_9MYCO|nr:hypothetical protein [Mycolicibacterium neworleansense]MCV7360133.1 hypothetical protein [Mycolicibacterium neworleansense]CRZ17263.1 hypothetical protein BN2156_04148 [Mycolicibacterium neworleansense]